MIPPLPMVCLFTHIRNLAEGLTATLKGIRPSRPCLLTSLRGGEKRHTNGDLNTGFKIMSDYKNNTYAIITASSSELPIEKRLPSESLKPGFNY